MNPLPRLGQSFELPAQLQKQMANLGKLFRDWNDRISADYSKIGDAVRRINEQFPESVAILARNGWFISWWHTPVTDLAAMADLFSSGDSERGHNILCSHFAELAGEIRTDLLDRFPTRKAILEKAFSAHAGGDYELSVPVFLAQADGIAKEVLGVSVYSRRTDFRKQMAEVIEGFATGGFEEPMLRLALEDLPLTASTNSPSYCQDALNRHGVLHGTDTDYPTRLNSFRALSLLQYAALFEEAARWSERRDIEVEAGGCNGEKPPC